MVAALKFDKIAEQLKKYASVRNALSELTREQRAYERGLDGDGDPDKLRKPVEFAETGAIAVINEIAVEHLGIPSKDLEQLAPVYDALLVEAKGGQINRKGQNPWSESPLVERTGMSRTKK